MTDARTSDLLAAARSAGASTLASMVVMTAGSHEGPAIRFREDGRLKELSYPEWGERVLAVAAGLVALGIEPGDRVAIMGVTRPEWTVADCAALACGATVVPVYHTNSPEECDYVLRHSGASALICESGGDVARLAGILPGLPDLDHVVTMVGGGADRTLDDLAALGTRSGTDSVFERAAAVMPEDLASIVYTSGTTGPPKGCRLSHGNLVATLEAYERCLELHGDAVVFLFLPLAHVLARVTQFVTLDVGATLAYWSGDATVLLDDLALMRPTHVPAVPRVFEKVRTRALARAQDAGRVRGALFAWALGVGRQARAAQRAGEAGLALRLQHAIADRLVLRKVRALFGDRLELGLTGAAPIAADVLTFFDACGVLVLEGYGLTESCAAATLNTVDAVRFGTVGRPLPGTAVSIAADGEILLRGPNVFGGYHHDAPATAEMLQGDGWLSTGDLGELTPEGFLRITGRKKDLIITSSGKNVTPANIESALRESRWISQAVVIGDGRPYLVALLTLDAEEAPALAEELGIAPEVAAMAHHEGVVARIAEDVAHANARFARIEQVKRFAVLERDLTQEDEELTPTLKVKRAVVMQHYDDRVAALYDTPSEEKRS